jgi:hypothetical protein
MTYIFGTPSFDSPFRADKKEEIISANLKISRKLLFQFYFDFYFLPNNQEDRTRIQKLAGDFGSLQDGKRINSGISIPINLTITRIIHDNESVIYSNNIYQEPMYGFTSRFFSKLIFSVPLEGGMYKIYVKTLQETPELSNVSVHFDIHVPGN